MQPAGMLTAIASAARAPSPASVQRSRDRTRRRGRRASKAASASSLQGAGHTNPLVAANGYGFNTRQLCTQASEGVSLRCAQTHLTCRPARLSTCSSDRE